MSSLPLLLLVPLILALLMRPFYSNVFTNPNKPLVILLVTAHPDDEVLFFAPTILPLIASKHGYNTDYPRPHLGAELYSLCLSTGGADGLGPVRALELERSLAVLGVEEGNRWVIDSPCVPSSRRPDISA
jgi:N-acetylglucosaminylphosphatidylinositol deacetylase